MFLLTLMVFFLRTSRCSEVYSRQRRSWIIDTFVIEEGYSRSFPYLLNKVSIDGQYQVYYDLHGPGVDQEPLGVFRMDEKTGELFVEKAVDYEEHQKFELIFEAKKKVKKLTESRLGIEIIIKDINDNPPIFQNNLYEVTVHEDLPNGSHLQTLQAYDRDQIGTRNSTFNYAIKSMSPESTNVKFSVNEDTGALSFNGCFDHQEANKYTLLVEAIDHGEVVRLSSSTTVIIHVEDRNNHLPVITGQTGSGKVKENEYGVSPLRLHVTDEDVAQSIAWKARYTIHGDEEGHFKIEMQSETNDGILTIVKGLDFERGATRELKISVENEAPYFTCKVKSRPSNGLWDVDVTKEESGHGSIHYSTATVVIKIEDVNDPPEFIVTVNKAQLFESAQIGTWVEKVTAVDRDISASSSLIYKIGHDPAGWMKIDAKTGTITTKSKVDRESVHVVNSTYTVILHAVDEGQPPMTGTATLQIYLIDVNDNVPKLNMSSVDVCLSDGQILTNISATDPDLTPYGGPFTFELLGDVKGIWKLAPSHGFTAGLVREMSVYAGFYSLEMKISDLQGQYGIYRLNVTVCTCSVVRNCHRRSVGMINGNGAVGIALALVILAPLVLLAVISFSCKTEFTPIKPNSMSNSSVDVNTPNPDTENPGSGVAPSDLLRCYSSIKGRNYTPDEWERRRWYYEYHYQQIRIEIDNVLNQKLKSVQEIDNPLELIDYEPHIYADEGKLGVDPDLEPISIPGDCTSFYKALDDLGPAFSQLASISMTPQSVTMRRETKMSISQHSVY